MSFKATPPMGTKIRKQIHQLSSGQAAIPAIHGTAAALRIFHQITKDLGLQTQDRLRILNLRRTKFFSSMKESDPCLNQDAIERLGNFLLIVDLAENLAGDAANWLKATNTAPVFSGKSPLEIIRRGEAEGILSTLLYLRGSMGGWA